MSNNDNITIEVKKRFSRAVYSCWSAIKGGARTAKLKTPKPHTPNSHDPKGPPPRREPAATAAGH